MIVASLGGFLGLASGGSSPANAADSSAITVSWLNDHSAASQYQPTRPTDNTSGHLNDFKNLTVSVSQTTNLIDQAVTLSFQGMATTTGGAPSSNLSNYLQVMQCWGNPSAANFRNTCEYGAWSSGSGNLPAVTAMSRVVGTGAGGSIVNRQSGGVSQTQIPFDAVDGTVSQPSGNTDGLNKFFNASTANEQDVVRIPDDGRNDGINAGVDQFNVQSAASAPWLGCGNTAEAAGTQCWLVIVPRGTHGGDQSSTPSTPCAPDGDTPSTFGAAVSGQSGSPLSTTCSWWDDRMVIPLSFLPTGSQCPTGTPEVSTNGSLLMAQAMSSWQGAVCAGTNGAVYNLITNDGLLTRQQLLQGQTNFAFIGLPVTPADDPTCDDPTNPTAATCPLFQSADIRYAPVANAALTISFVADNGTQLTSMKLTPRLVAKLLTQSYTATVPVANGGTSPSYLGSNPACIGLDPEFEALNPHAGTAFNVGSTCGAGGRFVVTGPEGDDALQALWQWVESDQAAVAWLSGTPDDHGMVINPYYLPASNLHALGGGLGLVNLATGPVDQMYREDPTIIPVTSGTTTLDDDSIAWNPFSNDFGAAAKRIFASDTQHTSPDIPLGQSGAPTLDVAPPDLVGVSPGKFLMGTTDAADSDLYGLNVASLQLPNQPGVFVTPTAETIAAAAASVAPESSQKPAVSMGTIDTTTLPSDAYPLTVPLYAAVNINADGLDSSNKPQYAHLLDYIATDGQVPGTQRGDLPAGYAPLTAAQAKQTEEVVGILDGTVDPEGPASTDTTDDSSAADNESSSSGDGAGTAGDLSANDGTGPQVETAALNAVDVGDVPSGTAVGGLALGGSLGFGLAGFIASPFLLRRRVL
ncbi:MAG: hypothetical protein WDM88_10795 [Galbitalea sp.]